MGITQYTCYGAVLCFTPYTHWSYMRFEKFEVTRTNFWFELWSNLSYLFKNIWNVDRLMAGWADSARCDYTIWPRAKMEHCGLIQYCISIQQWKTLNIGTKYNYKWYIPTYLGIHSFVSHVIICIWNLMYSVQQTGGIGVWMADLPIGNWYLRWFQCVG